MPIILINTKDNKICDRHFTCSDFDRYLKAEVFDLKSGQNKKVMQSPHYIFPCFSKLRWTQILQRYS
uniref:Uncharacterized protein n=1 Tax=Lepeophtheirus salmonis TaxID=72036 RepID=A0A0K2TYA0_LEPSM